MAPRLSIRSVLIGCFLFVIAVMLATLMLLQRDYTEFYETFERSNRDTMRLVYARGELRKMYESTVSMIDGQTGDLAQLEADYHAHAKNALDALGTLKRDTAGQEHYFMVDIHNMLLSYDESFTKFSEQVSAGAELIYLRQKRNELNRLRGYIENEISDSVFYLLTQSQDAYAALGQRMEAMRVRSEVISVGLALFCLLIAVIVSRLITRPIKVLVSRMRAFAETGCDAPGQRLLLPVCDEIGRITDNYDRMVAQIVRKNELERELNRQQMDNLEIKNLLHKAELDMLQMQMNPHFLFNTLNSISALCEMEDAPRASEMVGRLSNIMRHALTKLSERVPLPREIDIVRDYMAIQQTRFAGHPAYREELDEAALALEVPCMMIQPLIENAIVHGFARPKPEDEVVLSVHIVEGDVVIGVRDNGRGIETERLNALISGGATAQGSGHGIGLDNVLRRMRLLYGEDRGILESAPGSGTMVTLRIPLPQCHPLNSEAGPGLSQACHLQDSDVDTQ
jgi:sensor histidine kinase YesM